MKNMVYQVAYTPADSSIYQLQRRNTKTVLSLTQWGGGSHRNSLNFFESATILLAVYKYTKECKALEIQNAGLKIKKKQRT